MNSNPPHTMSNMCVRFVGGHNEERADKDWHYLSPMGQYTACGMSIGDSEQVGGEEYKEVKRGGATCYACIETVEHYKKIKL